MKRILLFICLIMVTAVSAFAAWDPTKPLVDDFIYNDLISIQENFEALELGTDVNLQITNAKVAAGANISDTKLASITTPNKVSGAALTSLSSVPAGAGPLPMANGGTGQTARQAALDALVPAQTLATGKSLVSDGTNASWGYPSNLTVSSATTGDVLYYNGTTWTRLAPGTSGYSLQSAGPGVAPVYSQVDLSGTEVVNNLPVTKLNSGTNASASTFWRGDGTWVNAGSTSCTVYSSPGTYTWTAPSDVNSVQLTLQGGGGGGGSYSCSPDHGGGGGGAGGTIMERVATVTPSTTYTLVVGAGGTAAASTSCGTAAAGGNGANTDFGSGAYIAYGGVGGLAGTGSEGTSAGGSTNITTYSAGATAIGASGAATGNPFGVSLLGGSGYKGGSTTGGGGGGSVMGKGSDANANNKTGYGAGGGGSSYASATTSAGGAGWAKICY